MNSSALGTIRLGSVNLGHQPTSTVTNSLAGVSAGVATVAGALTMLALLAGTSAGVATVSGTLELIKGLAGVSAGVATVTGVLTNTVPGPPAPTIFETPIESTASGSRLFGSAPGGAPRIFKP